MHTFDRIIAAGLLVAVSIAPLLGQAHAAARTPSSPSQQPTPEGDRLTPSELEELLGSIALYPDPLLANVLAASVYPDEVAEAATFVASGGKAEEIAGKSWEDPVKAVANIPDAIQMMGEYPDWTIALGQAYLIQAKDVMDVVQTLRKKAQANGALVSSPEQEVVVEKEVVYIESADPEVIYVPSYSPSVVYVDDDDDELLAGVIGFGAGITTGLILANNMDCDWHGGCVGWGHGGYHGDVDIERNTNIETGDINIGSGNTVQGGDRTNVKGGDRMASKNRVGNEGNAWAPNKSKSLANSKPNELGRVKQGATNRPSMPGAGSNAGAGNRAGGAGAARPTQQPGARPGGSAGAARPSQQPGARPGAGSGAARPSQQPAAKSRVPSSRPPAAGAARQPSSRSPAAGGAKQPSNRGASQTRKPSAFEGGKNTKAASQRGKSSSASAKSRSSGGGGGRSAPSRSGSGGGRGGGGRR